MPKQNKSAPFSTRVKRSRPSDARVAFLRAKKKRPPLKSLHVVTQQEEDEIARLNAELDAAEDFEFVIEPANLEHCVVTLDRNEQNESVAEHADSTIWDFSSFASPASQLSSTRKDQQAKDTADFPPTPSSSLTPFVPSCETTSDQHERSTPQQRHSAVAAARKTDAGSFISLSPEATLSKQAREENTAEIEFDTDIAHVKPKPTPTQSKPRTHLDILLSYCQQKRVCRWDEFLPEEALAKSKKLGEGVYGEVFSAELYGSPVALKIIPILEDGGQFHKLVNGERMKGAHDVLPEVIIATELSRLANPDRPDANGNATPSFVQLVQAAVVRGEYPLRLLEEWDTFDREKGSENDSPTHYSSPDRIFLVFALSLGGIDLERYKVRNEREAMSIFLQIMLSLAIAEECLQFEHRDLHIGNVLIDRCPSKEKICYEMEGKRVAVKSHGVRVTIIDFTNSRIHTSGTTIYLDLSSDVELFQGSGDYQFDIYRLMRNLNRDNWATFTPKTNLLWLHYMARKLFAARRVPETKKQTILTALEQLPDFEMSKDILYEEALQEIISGYLEM